MKLLLVQTDIVWNDPQTNFRKVCGLISSAPDSDLVVLPEMFPTGYDTRPAEVCEPNGGATTVEWMRDTARQTGAAITGSVAVEDEGRFYNRMMFVKPDGSATRYDKRHLFSPAGEHLGYTPGTDRVVVRWRGWRILLQVCYDLRFPVFSRQQAGENGGDYDMIVYSANWPAARIDAWNALLKARAIENLCYVAGVNRTGSDPHAQYPGETHLIDYKGHAVSSASGSREQVVVARADLEALQAFRHKFPALADADRFSLI